MDLSAPSLSYRARKEQSRSPAKYKAVWSIRQLQSRMKHVGLLECPCGSGNHVAGKRGRSSGLDDKGIHGALPLSRATALIILPSYYHTLLEAQAFKHANGHRETKTAPHDITNMI